jgi:hypothetical protein
LEPQLARERPPEIAIPESSRKEEQSRRCCHS